jgi:hypothetical protein
VNVVSFSTPPTPNAAANAPQVSESPSVGDADESKGLWKKTLKSEAANTWLEKKSNGTNVTASQVSPSQ